MSILVSRLLGIFMPPHMPLPSPFPPAGHRSSPCRRFAHSFLAGALVSSHLHTESGHCPALPVPSPAPVSLAVTPSFAGFSKTELSLGPQRFLQPFARLPPLFFPSFPLALFSGMLTSSSENTFPLSIPPTSFSRDPLTLPPGSQELQRRAGLSFPVRRWAFYYGGWEGGRVDVHFVAGFGSWFCMGRGSWEAGVWSACRSPLAGLLFLSSWEPLFRGLLKMPLPFLFLSQSLV